MTPALLKQPEVVTHRRMIPMNTKTVPTPPIDDKPEPREKQRATVQMARTKGFCTCRDCLACDITEMRRQYAEQQVSA